MPAISIDFIDSSHDPAKWQFEPKPRIVVICPIEPPPVSYTLKRLLGIVDVSTEERAAYRLTPDEWGFERSLLLDEGMGHAENAINAAGQQELLDIAGVVFQIERSNASPYVTICHSRWSLIGEGDTIAEAKQDLLNEAHDVAEAFLRFPVEDLSTDALSLREFLRNITQA